MHMYHTHPPLTAPILAVCVGRCMRIYRQRIELRPELYANSAVRAYTVQQMLDSPYSL